jgi:O-antigen ligase
VNRNLTSFSALLVGSTVLLFGWFGRRAAVPLLAAVLLLAAGVGLYRPMRERAAGAVGSIRAGNWDQLLSYRTAPWAAAVQMARDRPLTGYGPGTFQAEYVAHRLEAEIASKRRLANPLVTSTYSEAHCDYLQPFAEAGIPAGLLVLASAALLLAGIGRRVRSGRTANSGSVDAEAVILLALLAAGATAALTWFPFQRPISSVPLLLAAGRGWRVWRGSEGA